MGDAASGNSNPSSSTTTLSNSKGRALSLKAPAGKAPLAVGNPTRVINLNADSVDCPSGSMATGGGFADLTNSGYVVEAAPLGAPSEGFVVAVVVDETVTEDQQDVIATAVCYDPSGNTPNPTITPSRATVVSHLTPQLRRAIATKVAARE